MTREEIFLDYLSMQKIEDKKELLKIIGGEEVVVTADEDEIKELSKEQSEEISSKFESINSDNLAALDEALDNLLK